ncbi:hypothetical protein Tco_0553385, partial [Tanacetum coccineum]
MNLDYPEDDPIIAVDESEGDDESIQLQELTNQVVILQSQKHKLEHEKNKVEAKVALLTAQPSFPNVGQLNELLNQVYELEIELPGDLKEIPTKLEDLQRLT